MTNTRLKPPTMSDYAITSLPIELQLDITDLDPEVYLKWPLLSKEAAMATRFDCDLNKHRKWLKITTRNKTVYSSSSSDFSWSLRSNHKLLSSTIPPGQRNKNILLRSENWVHGGRHGECRTWHRNGQMYVLSNYLNGRLDGLYKRWFDDGSIEIECNYVNGKKHGVYKCFGGRQLFDTCFYINGKRVNDFHQFYINNTLKYDITRVSFYSHYSTLKTE
mmetsp:Transcript_12817/g.14235  ORF Transcript_12817/g.14235 Transcript_12817/m.14235 type:complete len:219 (+) Transcript_12817:132-788(+)